MNERITLWSNYLSNPFYQVNTKFTFTLLLLLAGNILFAQSVTQFSETPILNCNTTDNSIEFFWNEVPGAAEYQINVINGKAGIQNGNTYQVNDLNLNESVEIEVIALDAEMHKIGSATQTCTAMLCPPIVVFIEPVPDICLDANTGLIDLQENVIGSLGLGFGIWSGTGIIDQDEGIFDPSLASIGPNTIYFIYTENGCSASDSTTINVFFPPTANFVSDSPICLNEVSVIEATHLTGGIYDWSFDNGNIGSGNGAGPYDIHWDSAGFYNVSLSVTDTNGCVSNQINQTIEVVDPLTPPNIDCNTTTSSIEFSWPNVTGAIGYQVNVIQGNTGNQNGNSYLIDSLNPDDSVTIELTISGSAPCGDTTITHTCYATDCPDISLELDNDLDICLTSGLTPFNLNAIVNNGNNTGTGQWSGNGIINPSSGLFDPNDSSLSFGSNTVTYTYIEMGCPFTKNMDINIFQIPQIDTGLEDTISCIQSQVLINGTVGGNDLDILWTGPGIVVGSNTPSPTVDQPGWYFVTAMDTLTGCSNLDSIFIHQGTDIPVAFAGTTKLLTCIDTTVILEGSGTTGSDFQFHWEGPLDSSQMNQQYPVINTPGVFILTINNVTNNCTSEPDTVVVEMDIESPLSVIVSSPDTLDCQLVTFSLIGLEVPNSTYQWLNQSGQILSTGLNLNILNDGLYFFHVRDTTNGCLGRDTINIINNIVYPHIELTEPEILNCNRKEIILNASGSQSGSNIMVEWEGPPGGLSGPTDELVAYATSPGNYTLTLTDTYNGCTNDTTILVSRIEDGPIAMTNIPEELSCNTLEVEINAMNSLGTGLLYYEWYLNSSLIAQDISTSVAEEGNYLLVVTDAENHCTDTTWVEVNQINNGINGALISLEDPSCPETPDGSITIVEVMGGTEDFEYSIDSIHFSQSNEISGLMAGEYTLMINDAEDCSWDTLILISDPPAFELSLGDDFEINLGSNGVVQAQIDIPFSEIDTLIWSPMDQLTCIDTLNLNCLEMYAAPVDDLLISATLVDTNGCEVTDEVLMRVQKDLMVFIPNIFTPNNDGENDLFMIFGGKDVKKVSHFYVYDRWGEIVYEGHHFQPNDPNFGWNGKLDGTLLNPAVFVYLAEVEFLDNQSVLFRGNVTLLR